MSKNILITGANGGFGKLTALSLLKKGYSVVGTMRDIEGRNKSAAEELRAAGAHIVEIDVTNDESVDQGIATAVALVGELDVVINNAGIGVLGLQENFTPDDWQKLFDVNVFGVQRVNRAVLPQMRSRRSGLLIHITSLLGRIAMPFYGPYNASKWALEALAENYRVELSGFGVDVAIVEPGGFATEFFGNLMKPSDAVRDSSYGELAQGPAQLATDFGEALASNPAQNPQNVADTIVALIETPAGQRQFRTTVDKMGMGDPVQDYNEQHEQITTGIYSAFGIENMLQVTIS